MEVKQFPEWPQKETEDRAAAIREKRQKIMAEATNEITIVQRIKGRLKKDRDTYWPSWTATQHASFRGDMSDILTEVYKFLESKGYIPVYEDEEVEGGKLDLGLHPKPDKD